MFSSQEMPRNSSTRCHFEPHLGKSLSFHGSFGLSVQSLRQRLWPRALSQDCGVARTQFRVARGWLMSRQKAVALTAPHGLRDQKMTAINSIMQLI